MVEVDCKMLQVFRNWRKSIPHPTHHGSASYGMFSPGPVAEPIVARSSISSVTSLAMSISSLRRLTFTIGSQSITSVHWRRTISLILFVQNILSVYSFATMSPYIGDPFLPYLLGINVAEALGVIVLFRTTIR